MSVDHVDPQALADEAAAAIARISGVPSHDIALTLGSGWAAAADRLGETVALIPATEVPGFTTTGIPGHTGTLRSVRLASGKHALVIGSRTHLYEGKGVDAVAHGVRTAAAAGVQTMVLTNGAGGIDPQFAVGEAVLISDHINLTATSPLRGADFVDLTDLYSSRLRAVAQRVRPELGEGVYVQLPGPHFETPAEIQYLSRIGGQAVGMSTALEAIAARAAGLEVLGITLITNQAAGLGAPLDHLEVLEEGKAAEGRLAELLTELVAEL
ncbi:purine-nucleoside phosphorylase [Leucobacter sp. USHLN153]|uniref:purine-nucleoside phosphorylase n=1 Tax=Leucobacter sp. USHLN153 TaxID=3081268 RepID=UPI003017F754